MTAASYFGSSFFINGCINLHFQQCMNSSFYVSSHAFGFFFFFFGPFGNSHSNFGEMLISWTVWFTFFFGARD
jgi:hypothetical protein